MQSLHLVVEFICIDRFIEIQRLSAMVAIVFSGTFGLDLTYSQQLPRQKAIKATALMVGSWDDRCLRHLYSLVLYFHFSASLKSNHR